MNTAREDFKQMIYELVNGSRNLKEFPVKESTKVVNEFERGSFCSNAYQEAFNANERICKKLGVDEDEDVECIISNLHSITEHISKKMYDYGEEFAYQDENTDLGKIVNFFNKLSDNKKEKFMKFLSSLSKMMNEKDVSE